MVDSGRIQKRGPTFGSVDFIPLLQEKFGKIGTVLTSDPGDECSFHDPFKPSFLVDSYFRTKRLSCFFLNALEDQHHSR